MEKYSSMASGKDVSADLVVSRLKYSGKITQAASPPPKDVYKRQLQEFPLHPLNQ